ncbi:unnamed protein product [Diamesa tonsa]
MFMAWFFQNATQYMNDSFERSLTNGIRLYGTEPVWSLIWDDLQYNYKCCGIYSHTDWDKTAMYQEAINKVSFNESVLPYSCAKNSLRTGSFLTDDNIYTEGCFTIISQNIKLMTNFMIVLNSSIITLQVLILIMMRVVFVYKRNYSSSFDTIIRNDIKVQKHSHVTEVIALSIETALVGCQNVFEWEKWNCPTGSFLSKRSSQHVDREQAFVKALVTAAFIFTFSRNCSQDNFGGCGCDLRNFDSRSSNRNGKSMTKMRCSDSVDFGEHVNTELFEDFTINNGLMDAQAYANFHNSRAGKIAVRNSLKKHCRCHGLSGSCSIQTCWLSMNPFLEITNDIKRMYENSILLQVDNYGNAVSRNLRDDQLVYVVDSPDYCRQNTMLGWKGTFDRRCSRSKDGKATPSERRSCKTLCKSCGMRVKRQQRIIHKSCNCKFNWCCDVTCDTCSEVINEFYCE